MSRAQRHYCDVLGFENGWLDPSKEIGSVKRGEIAIFLRQRQPPFERAVHWMFAPDIERSYREMQERGANIVDPIATKPWGLRQFTIADIDGHIFHIHCDV